MIKKKHKCRVTRVQIYQMACPYLWIPAHLLILHSYSDALACCRCMTLQQITLNVRAVVGKSVKQFCQISEIYIIKLYLTISKIIQNIYSYINKLCPSTFQIRTIFTNISGITLYYHNYYASNRYPAIFAVPSES